MGVNREYKNSLFVTLFNEPGKLLSLYNAVSGGNLPPDTELKIVTLEDVLFTNRRNDIAFLLDDKVVVLLEHQSSLSENLSLRLLIYIARLYEKLVDNDAVYKQRLLKIPKPEFIVLYNGRDAFPDEKTLRLSDAYMEHPQGFEGLGGSLELTVRVMNVNEGRNQDILEKCETLHGYALFVEAVRVNERAGMKLEDAVTKAVKDCINKKILDDFLKHHGSEAVNLLTTEWNLEKALAVRGQESWEEGRLDAILDLAEILLLRGVTLEEIAEKTGVPVNDLKGLLSHVDNGMGD